MVGSMVKKYFLQTYGDSLTVGYPSNPAKSWPSLLATRLGTGVIGSGENGRLVTQMDQEKEHHLGEFSVAYVALLGGTNDLYLGGEVELMLLSMKSLVFYIEMRRSIPVVCLPPPSLEPSVERNLEFYRHELREMAIRDEVLLLDFDFMFRDHKGGIISKYFVDSVHLTEAGYELMGKQAEVFFKPLYESWKKTANR